MQQLYKRCINVETYEIQLILAVIFLGKHESRIQNPENKTPLIVFRIVARTRTQCSPKFRCLIMASAHCHGFAK